MPHAFVLSGKPVLLELPHCAPLGILVEGDQCIPLDIFTCLPGRCCGFSRSPGRHQRQCAGQPGEHRANFCPGPSSAPVSGRKNRSWLVQDRFDYLHIGWCKFFFFFPQESKIYFYFWPGHFYFNLTPSSLSLFSPLHRSTIVAQNRSLFVELIEAFYTDELACFSSFFSCLQKT